MSLRVAGIVLFFILALFIQPFACNQAAGQSATQAEINASQNAGDLGYKLINDPITGGRYYLIGSKYRESVASEKKIGPTNAAESIINATATKDIIPTKNLCESCVFYINSAEELRISLNNTTCIKKIILLESGKYNGQFYIGNNISNVTIKPDPKNRGSVILDAMNADFNFALENTSNVSINGLTLKNGNNGILLEKVKNCLVDGNKIYGFKFNGIFADHSVQNNSITNNIISSDKYQNDVSGITLSESRDVVIGGNEILVGYKNPYSNINGNNYIDILLNKSVGNIINFNGIGIITEDAINCGVTCDGDAPKCACESVEDGCQHFIGISNNSWSFIC